MLHSTEQYMYGTCGVNSPRQVLGIEFRPVWTAHRITSLIAVVLLILNQLQHGVSCGGHLLRYQFVLGTVAVLFTWSEN